ncbi:hypothetical protein MATL_G00112020 [Megalops atlanticus]|uniref:Transmembrane protein 82 n=1 Tax=Megalops atlanticus TaxID=7932 RepID=A0A9D3T6T8_MEGAT|nr:hypothetical protein MATL_G00112020 [Megalops atlanticus]
MIAFVSFLMSWIPEWLTFETSPLDSFLQGLVGACGISVLCNLIRVHLFVKSMSDGDETNGKEKSRPMGGANGRLSGWLQFWFLTGILTLVGSRVASLVVLEFSLRAISARVTAGPASSTQQFVVQCQFSLGLSLRLWSHVKALYPLHSSQRYCGLCIGLLTSGRAILSLLSRALVITFAVAAVTAISIINRYFLSATEALRFWTPLTICYTLLVVYMQDEQHRRPGGEVVLQTVVVRLGGLLVLMLTVGRWADVLHILVCFLGEAGCLIPSQDLLEAVLQDVGEEIPRRSRKKVTENHRRHQETVPSAGNKKNL